LISFFPPPDQPRHFLSRLLCANPNAFGAELLWQPAAELHFADNFHAVKRRIQIRHGPLANLQIGIEIAVIARVWNRTSVHCVLTWMVAALVGSAGPALLANGIYGNGTGARSMSMGGTDVAWAENPLEAMGDNPAGLGFLTVPEFDLGGVGVIPEGRFNKPSASSSSDLNDSPAGLPEGAFALPLGNSPVAVGISFIPDSTSRRINEYGGCSEVMRAMDCSFCISSTVAFDRPIRRTLPSLWRAASVFQPSTVSLKSSAVQWIW